MDLFKTIIFTYLLISFLCIENASGQQTDYNKSTTEWVVSNLIKSPTNTFHLLGHPKCINSKYGSAVEFDGENDGIFIKSMPLNNLSQFTIEVIFKPNSNGNFEQRFFHCGEINGSRVLLEIRATETEWYFDGFIKSAEQSCTLIDSTLLHPLNNWYHVAYTVDNGILATYIDGKKELTGKIKFQPINTGITSLGVRQNELSWFKGELYKIKISPRILTPSEFMNN